MAVNSTDPNYNASARDWSRAREVLAGEDAVKGAEDKYLPRLDSQTDENYAAYNRRASFFGQRVRWRNISPWCSGGGDEVAASEKLT